MVDFLVLYRARVVGVIVGLLCIALIPMPAGLAQARNGAPPFPQIPFFGDGNPLEKFFGVQDADELERLRRVPVTLKQEQEYGDRVLDTMRRDLRQRGIDLQTRGSDVDYVRRLVEVVKPGMKNAERYSTIRVLVADTGQTDAYSIPGGTIIVYQGMIEFAGSEAALVGVIGHELAHLDHGHQLLPLQRSKSLQTASREGVKSFDQFMRQASTFMSAFTRPFHPEDETQADRDGAIGAYRAGYDPREMALLFARLHARDQSGAFMPAFLRTHPYHADRQAAVEQIHRELQRTEPRPRLYVGKENIRRRVPMSERRFDE